jgi:hypothetical protein
MGACLFFYPVYSSRLSRLLPTHLNSLRVYYLSAWAYAMSVKFTPKTFSYGLMVLYISRSEEMGI